MNATLRRLIVLGVGLAMRLAPTHAAEPRPWAEKDTRLASEYLSLLVEKPDYGRVLDLLWDLYDRHQSTPLLIESIAAQARTQSHPNIALVHAHLLRKAGRLGEAAALYAAVLGKHPGTTTALRSLADVSLEQSKPDAALGYLKQLEAALPPADGQRPPLLMEQGRLALDLGRATEAAAAWERAVQLQPGNAALAREAGQLLLGAGFLDKALALHRQLARESDPAKKLDALFDLARLEEQSDHLKEAAAALREGMALLHFRDWRYAQFFQRLVKLHERFGQLDTLKAELLKAAKALPPEEKALADMARFAELTVDTDERIRWLRELVRLFPDSLEHRWTLAQILIDHEGAPEAAELLDARLRNDGSDPLPLLIMRCMVHLRSGEDDQAEARLRRLLQQTGSSPEVEKAVLAFARENSLDEVTESILKARVERDPEKTDAVLELAAFQRARQKSSEMQQTLERFAAGAASDQARRERLNQTAAFLAAGSDAPAAEQAARAAARQPGAGREELLRLADVLAQGNAADEALELLEQAWVASDTAEKRTDVDERILALLSGEPTPKPAPPPAASTEFKLPAIFTGEGFGSDSPPPEKRKTVADPVVDYALAQAGAVIGAALLARDWRPPAPESVRQPLEEKFSALRRWLPPPRPERILRAAWWCFRAEQMEIAGELLQRLEPNAPLEAQKLWLDIALVEKNSMLAVRQLRLLSRLDPGGRTAYQLRLAEQEMSREGGAGRPEAVRILEALVKEEPQNEAVLSALAQCYQVENRREDVLALWEKAVRDARGNVTPLLERQAEALILQRRFKEFIATHARLLEEETDLKRRRENFQRALERLLWADSRQGEITEEERKSRLELAAAALKERARRHPFDGFWHEALAQVHERQGDPARAFAEMKQAYYTAPDTPFSLEQLRASALRAGDMKSAVYFQKQIAAGAADKDEAAEWRELVHLLEQDFRTAEADQVRRRLESRFSQDAAALEDLARFYSETAQEDAARRVLAQIVRVRPWETRNLLRLALAQKKLGEAGRARESLLALLAQPSPPGDDLSKLPAEKLPWPVFDNREDDRGTRPVVAAAIDNAPGLETAEREQLRLFFSMPRDELAEVPERAQPVRLRALEELARLGGTPPNTAALPEMERAWWHFHSGAGAEFRRLLIPRFENAASPEARFLRLWLTVRSHGMAEAVQWVRAADASEEARRTRAQVLLAVVNVLAETGGFEFDRVDLDTMGTAGLWSTAELIDIARKLEGRGRHTDALHLGEAALRQMSHPGTVLLHSLASIAGAAGRIDDQRRYLEELWRQPIGSTTAKGFSGTLPGSASGARRDPEQDLLWYYERLGRSVEAAPPRPGDPFITGLEGLLRLARTAGERENLLRESWERVQRLAPSGEARLRAARVLGLAGADDAAAAGLADYLGGGFLGVRSFLEPIPGRLPPGVPAPGPRIDEVNHLRGYWEELREWSAALAQDGLAPAAGAAMQQIARRHGGAPLGQRTSAEFNAWRLQVLLRRLRDADHPERLRLVREHLEPDDSVELIMETGNLLESQGFSRECIEIFRKLPGRAPSNAEYSESFVRVCETSWDVAPAMPYLDRLFDPAVDPVFKPLTINFEVLREKHAKFLAMLHDQATLRQLAFRDGPTAKVGRIPEPVPYLREHALLLEREEDRPGALASWEQLSRLWPEDEEAALHRARILAAQGHRDRALEALRRMPAANFWNDHERQGLELRAQLAAEAGLGDELRELMNAVTSPPPATAGGTAARAAAPTHLISTGAVVALGRILAAHQRLGEAQSLFVRAERAVRDDSERFRLRLEQLKLSALDPSWNPEREPARIAALLRLETASEPALQDLRDWMTREGNSPRADAWFRVLQESAPRANVTLALAALGRAAAAKPVHFDPARLQGAEALKLAAETLVGRGQASLALRLIEIPSPTAVRAFAALNDEHGLLEVFARVVRMDFPGGRDTVAYAEAFAAGRRPGLAEEIHRLALERLRATSQIQPALVESHARLLLSQRRFDEAEALLRREHQGMTKGLAELLVDLYRGWNRLDRIDAELAKFHLPGGVLQEARYLAARELKRRK